MNPELIEILLKEREQLREKLQEMLEVMEERDREIEALGFAGGKLLALKRALDAAKIPWSTNPVIGGWTVWVEEHFFGCHVLMDCFKVIGKHGYGVRETEAFEFTFTELEPTVAKMIEIYHNEENQERRKRREF